MLHAPDPRPIVAQRAIMKITDAEIVPSSYLDNDGYPQKQIKCELQVLTGSERTSETFLNWFSFRDNGKPPHQSKKAGQLVAAVFGPGEAMGTDLNEMASNMIGRAFAAQIGLSEDGKHSRVTHDSIGPATAQDAVDGRLNEGESESPAKAVEEPEPASASGEYEPGDELPDDNPDAPF